MTRNEARDIFTDEDTWAPSYFKKLCAMHNASPLEDEWFGLTAARLWGALSDEERDNFTKEFEAYFSK